MHTRGCERRAAPRAGLSRSAYPASPAEPAPPSALTESGWQREFGWLDNVVRAKKPKRLPVVFSPEEATAVLGQLEGVRWLMGVLLYGAGLRLEESLRLRIKDLDFERRQVTVRDAKGEKDRVTLLPGVMVDPLKEHLVRVRPAALSPMRGDRQ